MELTALKERYADHPLGFSLKQLDDAQDLDTLHRIFIAAKTMVMLLEYQGELTREEATALEQLIKTKVEANSPGTEQKRYS